MRKFWAVPAAVLASLALSAQTPPARTDEIRFPPAVVERSRQVLTALFDLDYERADRLANQFVTEFPDEPMAEVLLARSLWSRQLNRERALSIERFSRSDFVSDRVDTAIVVSPELEARFRAASQRAKDKARARLAKSSKDYAARYALGAAYQNVAAFEYSVKKKWWPAYRQGENFVQIHRSLLQTVEFPDLHFANGMTYYLAASLPSAIKVFAVVFGFRGDKEKGKQELELAASKGVFVADDARTMLALLYARDKQFDKASQQLRELMARHPRNYLAHLELGGIALHHGQPEEAVNIYKQILAKIQQNSDGYQALDVTSVYNRLGLAHRARRDNTEAMVWFRRALEQKGGTEWAKAVARLELAKTLDLQGKRTEAVEQYRQLLTMADVAGTHREAKQFLDRPYEAES